MHTAAFAILMSLALPLALAAPAHAQDDADAAVAGGQVADADNAATWYRLAWDKYKAVEFDMKKWELIWAFESDPDRPLSAEGRNYHRRYRPALDMIKRATRRERCDFGPYDPENPESGAHLPQLRQLTILERDAYLLCVAGDDIDGATEALCVMFRIAGDAAHGDRLLNSLVGSALLSLTKISATHALDRGLIGPSQATRLLREVNRFKGDDPMGYLHTSDSDQTQFRAEMRRYSGEGGVDRFRADYMAYYKQESRVAELEALQKFTQAEFERLIEDLARLRDRITAALHEPDPAKARATLLALDQEIKDGVHGLFALQFAAYGVNTFDQMIKTRKQLDDLRSTLTGIADGTIDPMSLANAAPWYIRAAVAMEQVDAEARDAIDKYAGKHDAPADKRLRDILQREDIRMIISSLQTASNIDRADFQYARPYWASVFAAYHAGMLACGRLLLADASCHLRDKDSDVAAARLAIAYRMCAQIGGDGMLAGSLTAHRIFDDLEALTKPAMQGGDLDSKAVVLINKQLRTFSRADPFHYRPAIGGLRDGLRRWLAYSMPSMPRGLSSSPDEKALDEAGAIVDDCTDERIVTLVVMTDGLRASNNESVSFLVNAKDGLQSIFDLQAMQDAIDKAHLLADWGKQGVLDGLASADLPLVARVTRREKEAEESFRACLQRFAQALPADTAATKPRE